MNTKSFAKLTLIGLTFGLSQFILPDHAPQLKPNHTLNQLSQQTISLSKSNKQRFSATLNLIVKGSPSSLAGGGTR
ncbi:MAG: hypothetical protein SAK42_11395 [Oscillatoria sp. PMC 1076.18]|nr:hypothetical protein [Oscillatoria sp. PMC 1076.18]